MPSAAATGYNVKRATTSGGPYTTVASGVTSTNYTDTGLTNGVTYYYVVSASNAIGTGLDSTEVSVTPSTLVVQLKFDETGGTIAADSSGRAYNATLVNGPTFAPGVFGNAPESPRDRIPVCQASLRRHQRPDQLHRLHLGLDQFLRHLAAYL